MFKLVISKLVCPFNDNYFSNTVATKQDSATNGPKIDTNVFVVKFSSLSEPKPVHTGDPVVCSNQGCTAVLNHLSYDYIREEPGKNEKVTMHTKLTKKGSLDLYIMCTLQLHFID